MENKIVTVFGGTGFIGRYLVEQLAKSGFIVNVVSRYPDKSLALKVCGPVGKVVLSQGDATNKETVKRAVKGSWAVINLVGVLYEKGRRSFVNMHIKTAENIAEACKSEGVSRLVHISALGIDKSSAESKYALTKLKGEQAIQAAFPSATILRASLVIGENDNFFNMFAKLAAFLPALPLVGGGKTKFQPVYIGDLVKAIVKVLTNDKAAGKTYEIAGPKVYSFRELIEIMLYEIDAKRLLVPLPFPLAAINGFFLQLLPRPLMTYDQVKFLKYDCVSTSKDNLESLGIKPSYIEPAVSVCLKRYKKTNKLHKFA